jgi:hypothetical protein
MRRSPVTKVGGGRTPGWDLGLGFLPSAFCLRDEEWRHGLQTPQLRGEEAEPRARYDRGRCSATREAPATLSAVYRAPARRTLPRFYWQWDGPQHIRIFASERLSSKLRNLVVNSHCAHLASFKLPPLSDTGPEIGPECRPLLPVPWIRGGRRNPPVSGRLPCECKRVMRGRS